MKKPALSDLVLLIRSMSKAEKRAFRLQSSLYKTTGDAQKNYLRIYDAISHQPETGIKISAKTSDQEYLLEVLVDALVQQQRKSSLELDWHSQLSAVIVMHGRGLEKKAIRLAEKLLQLSWEAGIYEFGLEVVGVYMQMLTSLEDIEVLHHLVKERKKLLDALGVFQLYDELLVELFAFLRVNDGKQIRQFIKNVLRTSPPADVRSQVHRHHLLAHAYIGISDFTSTEKHHDAIQHLFEQNELFLRMRITPYIMTVLNNGILAWHSRNPARLQDALTRLQQLPKITGPLQAFDKERITRFRLDLMLRYHLLENKPALNLPLATEIRQALLQDEQMELHRANYLRYFTALSFFYCGRTKEALHWLQPIIDNQKKGYYNRKIYTLAFLLRAACHYSQGNDDIGDSLLLGFRRNKFFSPLRDTPQFSELVKAIPKGYTGEHWWV